MKHIVGVVPARLGSSRFPGKPLAPIHGMPISAAPYALTSGVTMPASNQV